MIACEHISKSYGKLSVFRDFSHTFSLGINIITGPSGGGKTTLLRMLSGLELPDSGIIRGIANKKISMVFQEDRLLPYYSGFDNVNFVAGDLLLATQLAEKWQLMEFMNAKISTYSGGMKRRLALIRALSVPFDILLLDEPFTGLDAENKEKVWDSLISIAKKRNMTILISTHEPIINYPTLHLP